MSEQIVLCCENRIEGIFTAIYDAFVYKNQMREPYTDSISIQIGENGNCLLFAREIEVQTDLGKSAKTIRAIQTKLGYGIFHTLFYALCHYDDARATVVLGYLVRAFATGTRITECLADPYVMRVLELSRKCSNECEKLLGFLRFRDMGAFLYAKIEPKCDALPLMQEHFQDRYPNENFVIYDARRDYAIVHRGYGKSAFVEGKVLMAEMGNLMGEQKALSEYDAYEELWRRYFMTIAIEQRENERCQNNMLPKWYRKNMLEFAKES